MLNFMPYEFMQAMQILSIFIGLYAIILGVLIGTEWPRVKKQK